MNKLLCPACGAEVSLEQLEQAADMQALHRAAAAYGDDWSLVREYVELFRGKQPLKVMKILRLSREVWEMWKAGKFCIGGCWYEVGREEFREALRTTCNQVGQGLTNHNYLKKVLVAAAEKTSQRRERELREKEEQLQSGHWERESLPPDDPEWRKKLAELGRALRRAKTPEDKAAASERYQAHLKETGQ